MTRSLQIFIVLILNAALALSQEKPNIIIFITDDQSQMDLGCYGNTDVNTPNMDKLAEEGMRFTKAYAATSMCTPSRSNMFTGLYPARNGSQLNHFAVNPSTKSLPHYMRELGYRVVLAGKTHVIPKSSFPFEHISEEMGKYQPIEGRSDPKGETVKFIDDYFSGEDSKSKPLCLIVATWWPHVPWMPNTNFDPKKLKVPEYLIDTKGTREALAAYYQSITEADNMLGDVLKVVEEKDEKDNTVFMFLSDQGVQFPGAKWTVYDQGLRVPFIVRWPGRVKAGSISDALLSLTDLTPTIIDLAGGEAIKGLDGKSFADVFLGKKDTHRDYIFAETSVEPHFWYNYAPSRSIITSEGVHYIRNYNPGVRFITHIDAAERNKYYFDSWIEAAEKNGKAKFLLERYSHHPAEELYDLQKDQWEFNNLVKDEQENAIDLELTNQISYKHQLEELRILLDKELAAQGETEISIKQGQLPIFFGHSYEIKQGISAHTLSFDKKQWNPDTLFITAYIEGLHQKGVIFKYFRQFIVTAENNMLGVTFNNGKSFYSNVLKENKGHLVMQVNGNGNFELSFNGNRIINGNAGSDHTKINGGYVSVGLVRDEEPPAGLPAFFSGKINNMRFTMNKLTGSN